jgi:hypothetical protein
MVRKSKLIFESIPEKGKTNLDILEMSKNHYLFMGLKVALFLRTLTFQNVKTRINMFA